MNGEPERGDRLVDRTGRAIGRIDAVFADYVLVRTRGVLPTDLYVPRPQLSSADPGRFSVNATPDEAYERWHRPLRSAPHD